MLLPLWLRPHHWLDSHNWSTRQQRVFFGGIGFLIVGAIVAFALWQYAGDVRRLALGDPFGCQKILSLEQCPAALCQITNDRCVSAQDGQKTTAESCTQACQDPDGCRCPNSLACYVHNDVAYSLNCGGSRHPEDSSGSDQNNSSVTTNSVQTTSPVTQTGSDTRSAIDMSAGDARSGTCGRACTTDTECASGYKCLTTSDAPLCWQPACDGLSGDFPSRPPSQQATNQSPDCTGLTTAADLTDLHVGKTYAFKIITGAETPVTAVDLQVRGASCADSLHASAPLQTKGPGAYEFTWTPPTAGHAVLSAKIWNGQTICASDCFTADAHQCLHAAACTLTVEVQP